MAWLVQFSDTGPLLAIPAGIWAAAVLAVWCLAGGRAALLLLVVAWTLCRAGWQLAARYPDVMAGRDILISGHVCDFATRRPDSTRFVFQVDDGMPSPGPVRAQLTWYEQAPDIRPGQRWQLLVRLRPPRGLANPGAFDFEQWLFMQRVGAMGYVRTSALNRPLDARTGACPVGRMRDVLATRIETQIGSHPSAGYVLGVTVGATHRLEERDWELMRRTGTTHLLAISGLNIAMVAAPFVLAGPLLGRLVPSLAARPLAGMVAGLLAAAVYTALSGFAVSTVRALFMLALATVVASCRRHVNGLDLLKFAALLIVLMDPAATVSVSFWLSFLAVAWLYVLTGRRRAGRQDPAEQPGAEAGPLARWHRWTGSGVTLAHAQLVLGIGLAPLSLGWFQQLSLISPLTNLLAVPVFTMLVMPLALLGSVLVYAIPAAGSKLLWAAAEVVRQLTAVLAHAAGMQFAVWNPPSVGWRELLLCAAGAVVLCWWRPLPWRSCALALLLPVIFGLRGDRPDLTVTVLDVGQGLAVLIQTARHSLLYDAGPRFRHRDAGASVVLPVLRHAGIKHLDLLVLSHDDEDHRGGAASVLSAFPGLRWMAPTRSETAMEYLSCHEGQAWAWDGVEFHVVSPAGSGAWFSDNDSSCVLLVKAPGASVLLPGDIDRRREEMLVRRGLLGPVDLVLAPHHGSKTSSGPDLVQAVKTRYVVFSAGHLNRWGFPAPAVLRRWQDAGACVLDTASSGALVFATDESGKLHVRRRQRAEGAHLWTSDVLRLPACPDAQGHVRPGGVE